MNIAQIQEALKTLDLDGWLFFDHHERDPIAYRVLGFKPQRHVTRRWYYIIPQRGEPIAIVHRIEPDILDALPGKKISYSGWKEQRNVLKEILDRKKRIAMQYSPNCDVPYVAMVDAGTIELVRSYGTEIVSSADLIQTFEARLDHNAIESHLKAGRLVDKIRAGAFDLIRTKTRKNQPIQELEVKNFILDSFRKNNLITDHGPIVGVNSNSSNPHYEPSNENSHPIKNGDFVLIDMWAKLNEPGSIYYDITWTGFCGDNPNPKIVEIFEIVRDARKLGVKTANEAMKDRRTLRGCDLDDVVRSFIASKGYGERFFHRTGHSLGQEVHGNGVNIDNLETNDTRNIIPGLCFTIEPGIYLDDFGVRSEVNLLVEESGVRVTGEEQSDLVII